MSPIQHLIYEKCANSISTIDFINRFHLHLAQTGSTLVAFNTTEAEHKEITGRFRFGSKKVFFQMRNATYKRRGVEPPCLVSISKGNKPMRLTKTIIHALPTVSIPFKTVMV